MPLPRVMGQNAARQRAVQCRVWFGVKESLAVVATEPTARLSVRDVISLCRRRRRCGRVCPVVYTVVGRARNGTPQHAPVNPTRPSNHNSNTHRAGRPYRVRYAASRDTCSVAAAMTS